MQAEARDIRAGLWTHPAVRDTEEKRAAMTVAEVMRRWLDGKRVAVAGGHLRESTLQTYAAVVNNRILGVDGEAARLRSLPVTMVERADIADWWEAVQRQFPRTAQRNWQALGKLREAMADAVEHGLIPANPVTLRVPKPRPKHKRMPEDWEFRAVLEHSPDGYRAAVALVLFHGLRAGEMLALRVSNVFVADTPPPWMPEVYVQVDGNVQRLQVDGKTTMVHQDPKTTAGWRTVPIFSEFVPLLLEQRAAAARRGPGALLTATATGQVVMNTSFRSVFGRARDAAGVPDDVHPHMGRHWLVTRLAESGATPTEIGAICGQEDVATVVGTYMKVREQRPAELMRRVGGTLDARRAGWRRTHER